MESAKVCKPLLFFRNKNVQVLENTYQTNFILLELLCPNKNQLGELMHYNIQINTRNSDVTVTSGF